MALTQTATIPGPSWDEEVVPALRKRLEIESRTIAKRLSGMPLINGDSHYGQPFSNLASVAARDNAAEFARSIENSHQRNDYQPSASLQQQRQQQQQPSASSSSRPAHVNGTKRPTSRSRTLSQPYLPDSINAKPRPNTGRSALPTRIPRSRPTTGSPHNDRPPAVAVRVNGFGQLAKKAPKVVNAVRPEASVYSISSLSTLDKLSHQDSGLLDEPPPFPTESMSSTSKSHYDALADEPTPRPSHDSEERPFEHWYRGEVSRNGGVGELRMGRRQEMLDIANYGHKLAQRQREITAKTNRSAAIDDGRFRRKRADSFGEVGRPERGSLYLDDEDMRDMCRVLDEDPPTDLDGEGDDYSDDHSTTHHHVSLSHQRYDSSATQRAADLSTVSEPLQSYESRSSTPTPATEIISSIPRINGSAVPSPRPSADIKIPYMKRGASEPPSSSRSPPPTPRAQRQIPKGVDTPSPMQKRAVSPGVRTPKPSLTKAMRGKLAPSKPKRQMTEEEKRRSVAVYPLSAGDDDMADAIPSWTQPKPKEGNWDEVVLPVVARKRGLDDQYERADGSPQPKRVERLIEPAPGTFGFNHNKFRPPTDTEDIPMDEFGLPTRESQEERRTPEPTHKEPIFVEHDEVSLPVHHEPPPSPVPFSDYTPTKRHEMPMVSQPPPAIIKDPQPEEDKDGAGCCNCVIM